MNKRSVIVAGTLAMTGAVAHAQPAAPADLAGVSEAVLVYDECLADATLRAKRVGAPPKLQHDLSKRSCESMRASLLEASNMGVVLASALDTVDRIRLDYVQGAAHLEARQELAHVSNPLLLEMASRTTRLDRRIGDVPRRRIEPRPVQPGTRK